MSSALVPNDNADPSPRSPRFKLHIPVDCSTRDMFLSNHMMNISHGGLFMASDTPLPIHSEVALTFTLPDSERTIRVKGRVIWSYDIPKGTVHLVRGAGIKFVDMTSDDRARLHACINQLAGKGASH